jgi:hypothetical protein
VRGTAVTIRLHEGKARLLGSCNFCSRQVDEHGVKDEPVVELSNSTGGGVTVRVCYSCLGIIRGEPEKADTAIYVRFYDRPEGTRCTATVGYNGPLIVNLQFDRKISHREQVDLDQAIRHGATLKAGV